jgi:hypothetical protein
MIQESPLETSLKEFAKAEETLVAMPVIKADLDALLKAALNANLSSLKVMDPFYEENLRKGKISLESTNHYTWLTSLCLIKFQEIMPKLNGQARHVELYSEQMRWRMGVVGGMYHGRNNCPGV